MIICNSYISYSSYLSFLLHLPRIFYFVPTLFFSIYAFYLKYSVIYSQILQSKIEYMKTETKTIPRAPISPEKTATKPYYRIHRIEHTTVHALKQNSQQAQLYCLLAQILSIRIIKEQRKYGFTITDSTGNLDVLYGFGNDCEWLHTVREGQYYWFILHCRAGLCGEFGTISTIKQNHDPTNPNKINLFYIEKINTINDNNAIIYHMAKVMAKSIKI